MSAEVEKLAARVDVLEAELSVAITAIHLLTTNGEPTSKWLDAKLQGIRERSVEQRIDAAASLPAQDKTGDDER